MKLFISWSGDKSKQYAEALHRILPAAMQFVKPYFTPSDIEKGTRWDKEISSELSDCKFGVFCLTNENLEAPWILFEAGAISKDIGHSRVCPILFGIDTAEVKGPLAQFQLTKFEKNDMFQLFETMNRQAGANQLEEKTLRTTFDTYWPSLEKSVQDATEAYRHMPGPEKVRPDREILEEILSLLRATGTGDHGLTMLRISADIETLRSELREARPMRSPSRSHLRHIVMSLHSLTRACIEFGLNGIEEIDAPITEIYEVTRSMVRYFGSDPVVERQLFELREYFDGLGLQRKKIVGESPDATNPNK